MLNVFKYNFQILPESSVLKRRYVTQYRLNNIFSTWAHIRVIRYFVLDADMNFRDIPYDGIKGMHLKRGLTTIKVWDEPKITSFALLLLGGNRADKFCRKNVVCEITVERTFVFFRIPKSKIESDSIFKNQICICEAKFTNSWLIN